MIYAGIGSRNTPSDVLILIEKVASRLAALGYTLRSGAAAGADRAFESGCDAASGKKEIYLPWKGFRNSASSLFHVNNDALEMAARFHPGWSYCSPAARKLHARNCYQILGIDLKTPCAFVVCWTPDGCEHHDTRTSRTGGTGQAISIASANNIPVFNLFNPDALDRLAQLIKS